MIRRLDKRDMIFNGQRPNDEDYGYCATNPICTYSFFHSNRYLSRLRTPSGESLFWNRVGATELDNLHGVKNVIVDTYKLELPNGTPYKEIFICPYGRNSIYAPVGMVLADENKFDFIFGIIVLLLLVIGFVFT